MLYRILDTLPKIILYNITYVPTYDDDKNSTTFIIFYNIISFSYDLSFVLLLIIFINIIQRRYIFFLRPFISAIKTIIFSS